MSSLINSMAIEAVSVENVELSLQNPTVEAYNRLYTKINLTREERNELIASASELDKWYTKPHIAKLCYELMKGVIATSPYNLDDCLFIEPSAGAGAFLDVIEQESIGFDLAPTQCRHTIYQNDFLNGDILNFPVNLSKHIFFLGNPPFGRRSELALSFFKKAFEYSNLVGFIIPVNFKKPMVQNQMPENARLLLSEDLPADAFTLVDKDKKVRCCFQVWALPAFETTLQDMRELSEWSKAHDDFEMFYADPRKDWDKIQSREWDFCIRARGSNIHRRDWFFFTENEIKDLGTMLIFFNASSASTLRRLYDFDYYALKHKYTVSVPGVTFEDIVKEYSNTYDIAA